MNTVDMKKHELNVSVAIVILIFVSVSFIGCGAGDSDDSNNIIFDPNQIFSLEDPNMYEPGYEMYFHGTTNNNHYSSADVRLQTKEKVTLSYTDDISWIDGNWVVTRRVYIATPVEIVLKLWSNDPTNVSHLRFSFITYFDPNRVPIKKTEINEHNNPTTFYPKNSVSTPLNAKIDNSGILTSWVPEYNEDITITSGWRLEPSDNVDLAKLITTVNGPTNSDSQLNSQVAHIVQMTANKIIWELLKTGAIQTLIAIIFLLEQGGMINN